MTNYLIWVMLGGVIGWLASVFLWPGGQRGLLLDVLAGIVGALLAGWFFSPFFDTASPYRNEVSLAAMLLSFGGAVVLLGIVYLLRRGLVRSQA